MAKRPGYSVDKARFESLGGSSRRYKDRQTGENISRAEAIKRTQGASVSSIARIRSGNILSRHDLLSRAYNRSGLPGEYKQDFLDEMDSLHPLDAPLRKGENYDDWIDLYEEWFGDYDSLDWDEFFGDSPTPE